MARFTTLARQHPRWGVTLVALALLLVGLVWWSRQDDKAGAQAYTLVATTQGDVEETVTAQGTLEPKDYVNVGAQVSGQLQKLLVEVGDEVSPSQLVAEIDPRVYESRLQESQAQVRSLQAQLMEQQAQLELAKQQHGRNTQLVAAQAISKDVFDTSAAALKAAQARVVSLAAQIEQSKSTLSEAQTNLSYTKIYAPLGGTVISQTARVGQTLNANQTAPTVIEIANLDLMTVRAQVAEADIGKIKAGMGVYFTTLGGERKWQAKVRQVLPAPQVVNDVVLYNVLADVNNPQTHGGRPLMSGMSTQMSFVVGAVKGAIVVPITALGKKLGATDTGTAYQIFVPQGADMVSRPVQIGLMNRTMAQVLGGLKVGDKVAVPTVMAGTESKGGSRGRAMGPRL